MIVPRQSSTDRAPQEEQADSSVEPVSHPGGQARRAPYLKVPGTNQQDVDSVHVGHGAVQRNLRR
jgi:hypothetical protein